MPNNHVSKYDQLTDFLTKAAKEKKGESFALTFDEIEAGFKAPLPAYARRRSWTSANYPHVAAVTRAGLTAKIQLASNSVIFTPAQKKIERSVPTVTTPVKRKAVKKAPASEIKTAKKAPKPKKECVVTEKTDKALALLAPAQALKAYLDKTNAYDALPCLCALNTLTTDVMPSNTDMTSVLIKVAAINGVYRALPLDALLPIAQRITTLRTDERLEKCDLSLIDDIAQPLEEIKVKAKNRFLFATAYVAAHEPSMTIVCDKPLRKALSSLAKKGLIDFDKEKLFTTVGFKGALEACRQLFGLCEMSPRDAAMYVEAKAQGKL